MKKFYSRLYRKEEKRTIRRTFIYIFLTLALFLTIIFSGIPLLTKFSLFLAGIQNNNSSSNSENNYPLPQPLLHSISEATNSALTNISGYSQPKSNIEIYVNDDLSKTTTADKDGIFTGDKITLTEGKNQIYVIAKNDNGEKSSPSDKIQINFDSIPPLLTVSEPEDGIGITGEKRRKINIVGQTETNATLTINDHLIILDQNNNFTSSYSLSEGENIIKVIATDKARNIIEKNLRVTFTK